MRLAARSSVGQPPCEDCPPQRVQGAKAEKTSSRDVSVCCPQGSSLHPALDAEGFPPKDWTNEGDESDSEKKEFHIWG